ncbi:MAG: hypothetical protein E6J90_30650 [Deltaproteobacteria bacterium]|nr:MAG: hypothetical protein E6J90_30650 [Deltaproteobacteria bacterium]TMQ13471.1 MAG: hypothetical protein E6J91_18180 [Deltaproteobacteria bacterium]
MTYEFSTGDRARAPRAFDPITEGAVYRLRPAVAQEIWDGACREATRGDGRRDEWQARQRFHAVAARVMARGGWLRPAARPAPGPDLDRAYRPWGERARGTGRIRVVAEALHRSEPTAPASPALDPGTPRSAAPAPPARAGQPDRAQTLVATGTAHPHLIAYER